MNGADAIQNSSDPTSQASTSVEKKQSMGKNEFLKLLTVQMQHQNPLSPMKGEDFSAQLAQFSQVEQLENINSGISSSNELDLQLTRSITNSLSTTMVGKEAKVADNQLMVDQDGKGLVSFNLASYADEIKVKILDSQGKTVKSINKKAMEAGENTINIDSSGLDLDNQRYTFEVQATDGSNTVKANPMMVGLVNSVRFNENGSFIVMGNTESAFSNVMEIGTPQ